PTTAIERIQEMDAMDLGFIYVVADNSITGSTSSAKINQTAYLEKIQKSLSKETMLGFGIRDAETASMGRFTNGIIIGSAFLKLWMQDEKGSFIPSFLNEIKNGIHKGHFHGAE
ncbi:MAG: tryptophan synthase subunit alpha, partial [Bacteroidota bacterium]